MSRRYPPLVPLEIAYILKTAGVDEKVMTPALELWLQRASQKYPSLNDIAARLAVLLTKAQA